MPDVPFEEITDDGYAQAFVDTCTVTKIRRGLGLDGTCPRCKHPMNFEVVTEVPLNGTPERQADVRALLCTCKSTHPGRPVNDEGCGAYWNIRLQATAS
ncbi:hypothetical protein OHB44_09980 [Micromonospora sp. NBC_00821]|uniref:hypothetical protein n=1 Tax=Micromonospora sp. NBC_00821 TaxID=2975977 RepID=UPI002ED55574|nr:hypothetical protein OHB44_09980 [Micromonospora sp. NBC_00821]